MKGGAIILLKVNGLALEDCNLKLTPGQPFQFDPGTRDPEKLVRAEKPIFALPSASAFRAAPL